MVDPIVPPRPRLLQVDRKHLAVALLVKKQVLFVHHLAAGARVLANHDVPRDAVGGATGGGGVRKLLMIMLLFLFLQYK